MNPLDCPLVSIVIPHWNAGDRTISCLDQFDSWDFPSSRMDIWVIDNGSTDGSSEKLAERISCLRKRGLPVHYHRFDLHPGLTASLNHSLSLIRPDSSFVLRLDNDVELNPDALSIMIALMQSKAKIGVVGPRMVYASAPDQLNSGAVWINPWGGKNRMLDTLQPTACDTVLGAAMLFRRSALSQVGRWFDPELFLFAEEPEICWQLRQQGYSTYYSPKSLGRHDTARSTGKHSELSTYLNYRNHTLVYARQFPRYVTLLRNLHIIPRILLRCVRYRTTTPWIGFVDGLLARPLDRGWWQEAIHAKVFRRP